MYYLDEQRFTMKEVALAAAGEAHLGTVHSWFQRGHLKIAKDERKSVDGNPHRLSLRTAFEVRIAWEFYDAAGVHPSIGSEIAKAFTVIADVGRDAGELFPSPDMTVLIGYPKYKAGRVVRCVFQEPEKPGKPAVPGTPMTEVFTGWRTDQIVGVPMNMNKIDRDVRLKLLQGGKGASNI